MKRFVFTLAAAAALLLGAARQATAALIDFEGYPQGTNITTQYHSQGVDFQNAIVLQSPFYNDGGYPPHSGTNVVYSGSSNNIQATAVGSTWSQVSLWYTSAITGLFLEAYDSSNVLLGVDFGGTNYGSNSQLSVSAAGIDHVIIHDSGNFFTVDDFSFTPSGPNPVPEPASLALLGVATMGLAGYGWRRRKAAVA